MSTRHHPHQALAGLMAKAEVQAERQPVWRPAVPRLQRRALSIVAASTSLALAAGAALMWDSAGDVAPRVVQASESFRPPVRPTPMPPRSFASVIPSSEPEPPRRDEALRVGAPGAATNPKASESLPPGVVPDDMPSPP